MPRGMALARQPSARPTRPLEQLSTSRTVMSVIHAFFSTVLSWFGYVGSCAAGSETTCRPFLAFVALTIASAAALALVLRAYRALKPEEERRADEEQRARIREREMQERIRRKLAERVAPRAAPHRGWRMPA